ncbi:MAG: NADH-quinone oxidoreductase subunit C, partial [Thermoproteota archaeon]
MHETIIDKLRRRIGAENILRLSAPRPARVFVWVDRGKLKEAVKFLKEEGFTHLSAITGLEAEGCIELLYHLSREGTILTLRVAVPPDVGFAPTITDEIPGAALYEREIYDLLGVRFDGHQNL